MKFSFFILGCILLYMSCLPCSDSKECNAKAEVKISATDDHQQHKHNTEACSPFCTCSCCAASVFYMPVAKAVINKLALRSVKYPICTIAFNTEVYYSIWQPPKSA